MTNMIEGYHRQLRKVTNGKSLFPNDESLLTNAIPGHNDQLYNKIRPIRWNVHVMFVVANDGVTMQFSAHTNDRKKASFSGMPDSKYEYYYIDSAYL